RMCRVKARNAEAVSEVMVSMLRRGLLVRLVMSVPFGVDLVEQVLADLDRVDEVASQQRGHLFLVAREPVVLGYALQPLYGLAQFPPGVTGGVCERLASRLLLAGRRAAVLLAVESGDLLPRGFGDLGVRADELADRSGVADGVRTGQLGYAVRLVGQDRPVVNLPGGLVHAGQVNLRLGGRLGGRGAGRCCRCNTCCDGSTISGDRRLVHVEYRGERAIGERLHAVDGGDRLATNSDGQASERLSVPVRQIVAGGAVAERLVIAQLQRLADHRHHGLVVVRDRIESKPDLERTALRRTGVDSGDSHAATSRETLEERASKRSPWGAPSA